ncbi:hypothetical protein HMPREF3039_00623 [Akkermansia sp. KLE1798]|nr:hypothetical protein HMPREF3039_00623 [Akkermansia sp. KLE1798]
MGAAPCIKELEAASRRNVDLCTRHDTSPAHPRASVIMTIPARLSP